MSEAHVTYTPRADATPERELDALVAVYSYVRNCAEKRKKSGPATAPDGTEIKEDSANVRSIPT